MAEFDNADGARRGRDEGAAGGLSEDGRVLAHSRSRNSTRRSTFGARGFRCSSCSVASSAASAGSASRCGRRPCLSDEYRRPPADQLAAVHPRHVRDDGARRGADGILRDVGAQQAAAALSPGLQRRAFSRASTDWFFLVIETTDPRFDRSATWKFLESMHPVGVSEVAP